MQLKKRQTPLQQSQSRNERVDTAFKQTLVQYSANNWSEKDDKGTNRHPYPIIICQLFRKVTHRHSIWSILVLAAVVVVVTVSNVTDDPIEVSRTTSILTQDNGSTIGSLTGRTQNRKHHATGNLFVCGRETMARRIFPEYNFQGPWNPTNHQTNATQNDILVVGMYGKGCPAAKSSHPKDLKYEFKGKVLFVRAEPKFWTLQSTLTSDFYPRYYQMGAFEYDRHHPAITRNTSESINLVSRRWEKHTLQLFYVVFVFLAQALGTERWEWITKPAQRRQNTAKYDGAAYFAKNCVSFRQEAASKISNVAGIPIYYGEGCTVGGEANIQVTGNGRLNYTQNYLLYHDYKYCLVMENTAMQGYITEKLLYAFWGGCIPIYYGTKQVFDLFNPDSFVFYDINNPKPALKQLQRLRDFPSEYERMLTTTILANDRVVDDVFSLFPEVGTGSVNRKIGDMMFVPPLNRARVV